MREGDYTYQLTVTDSAGHQSTAEVTVIVQPGMLSKQIVLHKGMQNANPYYIPET